MTRIFWLILTASLLLPSARGQVSELQSLLDKSEIANLARITRADHSILFFYTLTNGGPVPGYIRNGEIHNIVIEPGTRPDSHHCSASAISRDGARIAYSTAASDSGRCQLVLHDLRTGTERNLAVIEKGPRLLSWSWDDTEIAYGGRFLYDKEQAEDIFAVSVVDGSRRDLGRLRIAGKVPALFWELRAIEWLHHRPELVLEVSICLRTGQPGACTPEVQTLLFSQGNTRVLAVGVCAAVSPINNEIAYIGHGDKVLVVNADGSSPRVVTRLPSASFFLPFLKESPWSRIVWAPSGDRLLFNTIIDEGGNTNIYQIDVRTGHRRRVLKRTLVTITDWRR